MAKELAAGKMYRPTGIIHHSTSVYVVEQYNHRVSKWDFLPAATPPANFVFTLDATWGTNNDGTTGGPGRTVSDTDEFFNFPTGIDVVSTTNRLFVSDTLNHRIRVINLTNGNFVDSIGTPGTGDGELYRPAYIGDSANNVLAVADSGNHRVLTFDRLFPYGFVELATPPSEGFHTPFGVKYNGVNSKFYYSDLIRGKLYSYDDTGATASTPTTIGTPGTDSSTPNEIFYPGSGSGATETSSSSYLTDTRNNKIKEFTSGGVVSDVLTGEGTGDGEFYYPQDTIGFSQGATDYILVCNTLNNRIEVYDRDDDSFQNTFGSP